MHLSKPETFKRWFISHNLGDALLTRVEAGEVAESEAWEIARDIINEFRDANPTFVGEEIDVDLTTGEGSVEVWQIVDGERDDVRTLEVYSRSGER